ncbi:MAG: hypothetical protein Q8L92_14510, partial [Rubrivivax sp.]|nr:hypothetical protein [Rubrivivax sp.]
ATQIWFANATSSVSTELTLTPIDPADLGRPVDLLLRYRFQGLLRAVHSGDVGASAQARVQVDDGTQQALTCTPDVADPAFCRLDPIRAIYGTPFSYSAYLITSANLTAQPGPGSYSGDIEVDHSRSLEWVDASVYAPKGAALNGWALRAGQDAAPLFSSPVPEPRTVLMAALGVALVLRRTRRYKM